MIMQLKFKSCGLQRAVGYWAFAILCGSAAAACSGTIETPTQENPPRGAAAARPNANTGNNSTANDDGEDDDDGPAAPTPPAGGDDDEAELPADDGDDEVDAEDPPPPPPAAAGDLAFETDVWPIFQETCGPCHVSEGYGGQNVGSDDLDEAFQDSVDFEDGVLSTIESGRMPQGCGGPPGSGGVCLTVDDYTTIADWYEAGAPE